MGEHQDLRAKHSLYGRNPNGMGENTRVRAINLAYVRKTARPALSNSSIEVKPL